MLGYVMPGELMLHERPPFDPTREAPAATAICAPPRRFGDIIQQLRRGHWQNVPFQAVLGTPDGAAVSARWKVVGVKDELGMQHQGWQNRCLRLRDGRVIETSERVKRYVSTGDGAPEYYLAARTYEFVARLNLRPVV